MKTISLLWKNGWQALKDKLGIGPFEPGPMASIINENLPGGHGRPDINENMVNWMPTTHYVVQGYMDKNGYTGVKYFDIEYAVGGKGEMVPMGVNTFLDDPDYWYCEDCKLYVHLGDVASNKHAWMHKMSKLQKTRLEIRSVRDRFGNIEIDEDGRAVYYFGAYKDVSTGRAVHTPKGYKEIFRSEVMNLTTGLPEVKGPAANTDINGNCACQPVGQPVKVNLASEVTPAQVAIYQAEPKDLGEPQQGDVIIDEAFGLRDVEPRDDVGDLPRIEDPDSPKTVWVRFARSGSFGGGIGKYFEVEFRGQLTPFNLVDGDQGELETIGRFLCSKSDQTTRHRIHTTGNTIIDVTVDWKGYVIDAQVYTSEYLADGTRHDVIGKEEEFFLPSNHTFFRHVNINTVMKGLI